MSSSRRGHVAVLVQSQQVLIAGGIDDQLPGLLSSAELFDPYTLTFVPVSAMSVPRFDAAANLLEDGTALITGGLIDRSLITDTAELYDPHASQFNPLVR
jgi:hypothetical protein